ncbi:MULTISPECIES: superoxide dismutase [Fe] [unclassified Campylobacter]|uniref:superoxide dismutase [Fe] n=1 Tax=unclassified Campylobacter TaxID=2593542 RepID=UPI001237CE82|nr:MULTISPECIES: superoxide dismutase [Fe] [unclassified Campylobacter]KAA6226462.1 superoxide dismutase [Fe] [Campylobacter sp. LR185c]KAA6228598.1 superoxide dismutase [Fe] [Campylobacter sp. LR196d]KAA6229151.1 superoxide dismutase [Fe] [Campylobacter sp. LR286c]KAA6233942.1 superoxide dismutase [Fe] [Campylobacter sp. LR291e]KAA6234180.1 superoxide dismutase [Fe] [Campylobacter sp. LR264d]
MFELRTLPYDTGSFVGFLSAETFSYHHGKHHQTYVNNLNNLISGNEFENKDLVSIIKGSSGGIFNNAAQVYNHDFYFDCIQPICKQPFEDIRDDLKLAIEKDFGSLDNFKTEFIKGATGVFGSGWFWLVYNTKTKKLELVGTSNAATPIVDDKIPLLVVDVWEHAYYVDHRNARPAYLEKFFGHINWVFVSVSYEWALKEGMNSVSFYANKLHPIN